MRFRPPPRIRQASERPERSPAKQIHRKSIDSARTRKSFGGVLSANSLSIERRPGLKFGEKLPGTEPRLAWVVDAMQNAHTLGWETEVTNHRMKAVEDGL
jgi:hypothetical protein